MNVSLCTSLHRAILHEGRLTIFGLGIGLWHLSLDLRGLVDSLGLGDSHWY